MDIVITNTVKESISRDKDINKEQFQTEAKDFKEKFREFCNNSQTSLEKYINRKITSNAVAMGANWPKKELQIVVESTILFGNYLSDEQFSGQAHFVFKGAIPPSYEDAYYQAVEDVGIRFWNELMDVYKAFLAGLK